MRNLLVLMIILGSIPMTLVKPHIGALMWAWVSFMNPHRLSWTWMQSFPVAEIVGIVTLVAFVLSGERKKFVWNGITILLAVYVFWFSVTTLLAVVPQAAVGKWEQSVKILLMAFVTIPLINTRERLDALIWVIVISIGFFGVKGGIFVIITGGDYIVWGPPNTMLGANNALALALIMTLPLMRYLQTQVKSRWLYWALFAAMVLSGLSIAATYSRGAFLAGFACAGVMALKSQRRLLIGTVTMLALIGTLAMMPEKWYERMQTIENYEQDKSAQGRIEMWKFAFRIAVDRPLFGGGFHIFDAFHLYPKYNVQLEKPKNAHSVYFEVLGEQGFIGLTIYLLIGIVAFRTGTWIAHRTRDRPELSWARVLAQMLQVCLVGFAVGGTFLNKAHFDLYFHFLIIMCLVKARVVEALDAQEPARLAAPAAPLVDHVAQPSQLPRQS